MSALDILAGNPLGPGIVEGIAGAGSDAGANRVLRPVRVFTLPEFLAAEFPPPEPILAPILFARDLVMIYSWRGVGKSHVALGLAYAIATGSSFLRWRAPKPRSVLLVDGENDPAEIQRRLAEIVRNDPRDGAENVKVLARLAQPDLRLPLAIDTSSGQATIEGCLDGVDVLILDNVSSLSSGSRKENDVESWAATQDWLVRLRGLGITVVFFHHTGKDQRTQRGTSGREDILNTCIRLEHPSDYEYEQGARFNVIVEKARSLSGAEVRPVEAWLRSDDGKTHWQTTSAHEYLREEALEMTRAGKPDSVVARALGIERTTVWRWRRAEKVKGS